MKYTVTNLSYRPHDLDDDFAYFNFDIRFTEPEELFIKDYFFPFGTLLKYIKEKNPAFYTYIEETRTSIDNWGPREVKTLDALGDEGVKQVYEHLLQYFSESEWPKQIFEHQKKMLSRPVTQQQKEQKQAKKVVADLGSMKDAMKNGQKRYYRFCETVEKQIRQTAVEVYPEIANLPPEKLKEFKYFFVREIQAMHSNLYKFLNPENG